MLAVQIVEMHILQNFSTCVNLNHAHELRVFTTKGLVDVMIPAKAIDRTMTTKKK